MAEIPPEVVAAIKSGDYIVCYAKCVSCQFGSCPGERHTWMDHEDIEHEAGVEMPTSPAGWFALALERPCGCHCQATGAGRD
ncbi:MAG: hypothetical protein QOE61_3053 [Micromonosporaceae bacterium]|uniref:hypothetical protein n=1 Tax=Mycobacterium sp. TaxID=1785 RepID=UPI0028B52950|nr:hypothetical protein [Mycobacterium sp.]MDT5026627.1 hypothetical protein [Micromonosporaceae bacterium]MDT5119272.1 hypothetical protein [Mycobacterium sp.]